MLYRVLGNDLPPRHAEGQTLRNLRFILANEPELPSVEKRWLLNRIVDPAEERQIVEAAHARGHRVDRIAFSAGDYLRCWVDAGNAPASLRPGSAEFTALPLVQRLRLEDYFRRAKNLYLMNNNGARNAALRLGLAEADWVMPWDGGCFLTPAAWEAIRAAMAHPEGPHYVIVPMARLVRNESVLDAGFMPGHTTEPQIAFSRRALERFDPALRYGSAPKALLLRRLGIPGPWQRWAGGVPWETPDVSPARDAGAWRQAGWVARLSGEGASPTAADEPEGDLWQRRFAGIFRATRAVDLALNDAILRAGRFRCWIAIAREGMKPHPGPVEQVRQLAQRLERAGPFRVTGKPRPAPGGTLNDYFSIAPHLHETHDGLLRLRDGERREDAVLYSSASERYDRSRLQRMIDACCVLTLDRELNGVQASGSRAADLIRAWFLDPASRMNPSAEYAQFRGNVDGPSGPLRSDAGNWTGIVDFRDFHPLLDAIRMLVDRGALSAQEDSALREWFDAFLSWLLKSGKGASAAAGANNVATWHWLVVASLSAHLGNSAQLTAVLDSLPLLVSKQFDADGSQPQEARRTRPVHYALFNLQAWASLATVCRSLGRNLWGFVDSRGRGISPALDRLRQDVDALPEGDERRAFRVRLGILEAQRSGRVTGAADEVSALPDVLHPDAGVPPFWRLALAYTPQREEPIESRASHAPKSTDTAS